ncbi:MAG: flagellin lysine-N-methylase [Gammaproteobacteria bacterium]|nr:flagellin lysine-N-methylase [Gammaproteobacteria bacterium]MDH5651603.1 flagellin lysine-N-methylase [Gammaproteobacteria bacterium]
MSGTYKTFKYMLDFACLGGKCEDTCCKGWDIRIDKFHYQLMQEKVAATGAEAAAEFARHVQLNDGESAGDQNYAHINLRADGFCPFLDQDSWCSLHKNYGEAPLSNICAYYPRVLSQCGNTVELSGAMSCPEMVRKCLFGAGHDELVDFDPAILPRPDDYPLTRELSLPADDDYYDHFVAVRNILMQLATLEGFSFESRLYFMATFANRIGKFYHHDCQLPDPKRLTAELKQALNASGLEKLDDFVIKYSPAEPIAVIVVQSVLQLRMQQFPHEYTSRLATEIFQSYAEHFPDASPDVLIQALPPEPLWALYRSRKETIDRCFSLELEEYLSRFLVNCLYREWFITMPDLFTYLQMLVIRLAVLRFLLYSHTGINQLAEQLAAKNSKPTDKELGELRDIVVKVVYNYSRSIDHNLPFLRVVYDAMNEQQMMTFDYAMPFIRF